MMDEGTPVFPAHQYTLRMPAEIAAQIVAHAQSGYPHGVCGLVTGN